MVKIGKAVFAAVLVLAAGFILSVMVYFFNLDMITIQITIPTQIKTPDNDTTCSEKSGRDIYHNKIRKRRCRDREAAFAVPTRLLLVLSDH